MVKVLHLVQKLTKGGASRALLYIAKYSQMSGEFSHSVCSILECEPEAAVMAQKFGVTVYGSVAADQIGAIIDQHDIVQVHWWNNPDLDSLLRRSLNPARMIGWYHVGGHHAPQIITPEIVEFFDVSVACSPFTLESPALRGLDERSRHSSTMMIYGATDFARFDTFTKIPHTGFNVGYIGTVDYVKMHPGYFRMSSAVNVPEINFYICGGGGALFDIAEKAKESGRESSFKILGHQENLLPTLGILDVYGYPLCEGTYAASELNLQEVMYLGIPPVVFPYGGVKNLIVNDFTGIIVSSELEYAEAIRHLYENPEERLRLGNNAREYARQIFGAERAAAQFNQLYLAIMSVPKTTHTLQYPDNNSFKSLQMHSQSASNMYAGTVRFLAGLHEEREIFLADYLDPVRDHFDPRAVPDAIRRGALYSYGDFYGSDPILSRWCASIDASEGRANPALNRLIDTINKGGIDEKLLVFALHLAKELQVKELVESINQIVEVIQRSRPEHLRALSA